MQLAVRPTTSVSTFRDFDLNWIDEYARQRPPSLALSSRGSRDVFFCFVPYFPARNPRPEMLGPGAARHGARTLMERARTMLVIQRERAYPSRSAGSWKLESPKLLRPARVKLLPISSLSDFFPLRGSEMSESNVEIRHNEKERHTISQKLTGKRNTRAVFIKNIFHTY